MSTDKRTPPGLHRLLNYGREQGKIGWILLWLLGVPIPVLFVLFLVRGCTAWSNGSTGILLLGAGSLVIGNVARANGAEGIFLAADNGYAENVATGNVGADISGGDAIGCNLIGAATVCPP